jgi:tryptophan synthase alpha chain
VNPGSLSERLREKKLRGEKVLVSYLVAGHPNGKEFLKRLAMVLEVSDLVEIGFPFSDPLADGATIQRAYHEVLERGLDLEGFFRLMARASSRNRKPLVLMSYLNPVLRYGLERAASRLAGLNFQAVIFPDLPLEEGGAVRRALNRFRIELVHLLSPATGLARARDILEGSQAFVYLVSLKGVTGARREIRGETLEYLRAVRKLSHKPLYVGFGISHPRQVARLSPWADGVIVGSALLDRLGEGKRGEEKARRFLNSLKEGFDP